ncbi:MAG: hypothetical protein OJF52_000290 [Nitrospira sp.]|jgi:hypothetical protein|nr:MAG: hypothetical protein OJF52_000290 [Nitrospira sp.]
MLVLPDERVPIARLLSFLEQGERMAHTCAKAQVALAPDATAQRFLTTQAKQEAVHAMVFQGAIAWLAPRHLGDAPFLPALEDYRRLLDEAIRHGDWLESILAEQVILEGLGEAILMRIEAGMEKRGAPFQRLRRILLGQEEAHHGFGRRVLEQALTDGRADPDRLRRQAEDYLVLTEAMVLTLAQLFETIDEDAAAWAADVRAFLPNWLAP